MKKIHRMSDCERKIMEFIWATKRPVTTQEIVQYLPEARTWKQSTVVTFLSRLIKKGLLKGTRIGKANYYEPNITEEEYKRFETMEFIKDVYKGSAYGFLETLINSNSLTKEDIENLLKRLKK